MKRPSTSVPEARKRREEYYELRRQGVDTYGAMLELGVSEATRSLYERWFKATEAAMSEVPYLPVYASHRESAQVRPHV
jgi:hypothetical protein